MKEFKDMHQSEKKDFLSADFAERMIRVEQSVSASFHQPVKCRDTEYYKSMTSKEKENLLNFLRTKKIKRSSLLIGLVGSILLLFLFGLNLTGNVTGTPTTLEGSYVAVELILIFILVLVIVIILFSLIEDRRKQKRFHTHAKLIHHAIRKKNL